MKLSQLLPLGVVLLASGLLLHNSMHGDYADSISGFLIGVSLVFMITGFAARSKQLS